MNQQTLMSPSRTPTFDRPLSDDDRALLAHVQQWGVAGYPIQRYGKAGQRRWSWTYGSLGSPLMFRTRQGAVAALERYLEVLASCRRAEQV